MTTNVTATHVTATHVTATEAAEQLLHRLAEMAPAWQVQQADLKQKLTGALADEPNQLLTTMSYAEFLDWADAGVFAEWENGKVILMSPTSLQHARLFRFLFRVLDEFVERTGAGELLAAPFQMHLPALRRGREPDIFFVAKHHRSHLKATYLDGPADLAVEIVSPESEARDRIVKFAEYAQAGVSEYWLVDPLTQTLRCFRLTDAHTYAPITPDAAGRLHSAALPGLWLRPAWLWQEPLPTAATVLQEILSTN